MTTTEESPGHLAGSVPTHLSPKSTQQIFHKHLLPHAALDLPLDPSTPDPQGAVPKCKPSYVLPQVKSIRVAMTPSWPT